MMQTRHYLIGSFMLHMLCLLVASCISNPIMQTKKTFIVFGAHTQKPSNVSYKKFNKIVPFVTTSGNKKVTTTAKSLSTGKKAASSSAKTSTLPSPKKKGKSSNKIVQQSKKQIKEPVLLKKSSSAKQSCKEKQSGSALPRPIKTTDKKVIPEIQAHKKKDKKVASKLHVQEPIAQEESIPQKNNDTPVTNQLHDIDTSNQSSNDQQGVDLHDNELIVIEALESTTYQKEIQQEVDRLWKPPLGVPKGTMCSIQFVVLHDGTIECSYAQRSSVLIYDLSIMRVAKTIKFSKALWGKQFNIVFRQ